MSESDHKGNRNHEKVDIAKKSVNFSFSWFVIKIPDERRTAKDKGKVDKSIAETLNSF